MRPKVITPTLKTTNLDRTIDFYTALGFVVESAWPEQNPTFCILDNGPTHLMFYTEEMQPGEGSPTLTGQLHIDLENGVQELYEKLRRDHEVLWGPEVYEYGRREFSIRDPNGYRLVFSEVTNDPPKENETRPQSSSP